MWFVDMIYIGSRFSCSRVPKLSLPIHQRGLSRNMVDYFCSHRTLSLLPRRSRWLSLGIPFRCQSYRYKIRHVTSNRCYLHYQWIVQHLFELSFVPCENLEYNPVGQWQNLRAQEFVNFLLTDRFRISSFSKIEIMFSISASCRSKLGTLSNDHDDEDNNSVKKQLFLCAKQLLCTCITLFSTFLWRPLHDYDVKPPSATFHGGRGNMKTNFPFAIWTWIKPLRI